MIRVQDRSGKRSQLALLRQYRPHLFFALSDWPKFPTAFLRNRHIPPFQLLQRPLEQDYHLEDGGSICLWNIGTNVYCTAWKAKEDHCLEWKLPNGQNCCALVVLNLLMFEDSRLWGCYTVLIGRFLQTFRKIVVSSSGPTAHEALDCFTIYRLIWRHPKNRVVRNVAVGSSRLVLLIPALLLVFFTSAGRQIPLARSSWRQELWKHVLRLSSFCRSWLNKYSATKQLTHLSQRTIFAVTSAEGKGAVCACFHLSAECLNRPASLLVFEA